MNAQSVDADKAAAYDPLNPAVTANPYPYYAALREHTPVKWLPSMQGFAVSRWDDVVKVLSDGKVFSSAQFWPALLGEYDPVPEVPPMISLDPPGHLRIRKLASKAFVPSRVGALEAKVHSVANALVADITARHGTEGEFDFVWTHFGFADDTPEMTQRRLRQANLFGPAGFVSADDGEVIEFSQGGFRQWGEGGSTLCELDGTAAEPTEHMVTETLIRGMYAYWKKVMGV